MIELNKQQVETVLYASEDYASMKIEHIDEYIKRMYLEEKFKFSDVNIPADDIDKYVNSPNDKFDQEIMEFLGKSNRFWWHDPYVVTPTETKS